MIPGADGLIGAAAAVEGVVGAKMVLHGQNGCRKALTALDRVCPLSDSVIVPDDPVYRGCSVVPYSAVNEGDYTRGAGPKLLNALRRVAEEDYGIIVLTCSPGLSIIGDDCPKAVRDAGLEGRTAVIDTGDISSDCEAGFDYAMSRMLSHLCSTCRNVLPGTAVVVGLGILHRDWEAARDETERILGMMGITVICFAGAGCTAEELAHSVDAEYCIDLCPESTVHTRSFYEGKGLRIISPGFSPVGFDASAGFAKNVAELSRRDASPALSYMAKVRRRAYRYILASGRDMRGTRFFISSTESVTVPLRRFLEDSFAMIWSPEGYEVLLAEGDRCAVEKAAGICPKCIDIGFPTHHVGFGRSPVLWTTGTMYLLESLFG